LVKLAPEPNKKVNKTAMAAKDSQILRLKEKINDQEQYVRGWSIRVLNLKIPPDEATDPEKVMLHVFNRILEPILQGALAKKLISSIPPPTPSWRRPTSSPPSRTPSTR
jgi:hypothetical protein